MLNKNNERELAYVVVVDSITPMNADRLECANINGWHCVVGKGEFKAGDKAVYFEIDSKLPEVEPFSNMEFLRSKKFKIKSQKIRGVVSQGLLVPFTAFNWEADKYEVGEFLTKALNVTYAAIEDNARKANSDDKYKKMARRHPKLFKNRFISWLMKRNWGKKFLFFLFGKKKDKRTAWPSFVSKTDEERVQNIPWILNDKSPWIATEKIDGTSTTAAIEMKSFGRHNFYICSRNVVFDKPDKQCYYSHNVYTEMAQKYDFEKVLLDIAKTYDFNTVALQGETYGEGIQKRDYSMKGIDFVGFNLYVDGVRLNSEAAKKLVAEYGIPWVPIVDKEFVMPDTVDELLEIATGESVIDKLPREGLVFRSLDGTKSFKAVSNSFLLKYHQ